MEEKNYMYSRVYWLIRRICQITFSLLALLVTLPLSVVACIAVKFSSPGPILYKGKRVGKDGKLFTMYKFRTMHVGTEAKVGGRLIKNDGEGRITKVGRILRLLKLDELPQLLNVIKGDMNIVGPRPIRPTLLEEYLRDYPNYTKRFAVKPGITGLAQTNGGYYIHPRNKLRYDILYIKNQSLWLDLKLVAKTGYLVIQKVALRYLHKFILKIIQLRNGRKHNSKTTVLRFHSLPSDDALRNILFKNASSTIRNLKRALKENPRSVSLNYDLGLAYLMVGKQSVAQFYFHSAGEVGRGKKTKKAVSDETETHPVRAREEIFVIADNPRRLRKKILPFLEQHISANSCSAQFYNNIGVIYAANGEYQRAITFLEQAIALIPNSAEVSCGGSFAPITHERSLLIDALTGLGDCYFRLGQFDLAVEKYEAACEQNETDASLHFKLGLTFAKSGVHAAAVERLKQALSIDQDLSEAQALLKSCQYQLGWDTE